MQGKIRVYPTEACYELALPGVDGLLCLAGAVVVCWAQLEVDAVCPEENN